MNLGQDGVVAEDSDVEQFRARMQRIGLKAERDCLRAQAEWQAAEIRRLRSRAGVTGKIRSLWETAIAPARPRVGGPYVPPPPPVIERKTTLPLIAVIVDAVDWSFANIARQMQKHLSDEFEFHIISTVELEFDFVLAFYLAQNCDLIHFMWRESVYEARAFNPRSIALYFGSVDVLNARVNRKTTFTVYDHLFSSRDDVRKRADAYNKYVLAYAVCSRKIWDLYTGIQEYPNPSAIVRDGVDLGLFKPANLHRLSEVPSRPLRLGWVGNSNCASDVYSDLKGFQTILEPAIDALIAEGYSVEKVYADRQVAFIPHRDMPGFYSTIDVLVCTSAIEGTPNPILEAMACGVPIITTDVGIVPDAFGDLQKQFILARRDVASLKQAIVRLRNEPQLLPRLSDENLSRIREWDWPKRIEAYRHFFRDSLEKIGIRTVGRTPATLTTGEDVLVQNASAAAETW